MGGERVINAWHARAQGRAGQGGAGRVNAEEDMRR